MTVARPMVRRLMEFVAVLLLAVSGAAAAAPDFTIVVLPDTQFYSQDYPDIFRQQIDWIVANRTNLNVVYVASVGDMTDDADIQMYQWTNAASAMYRLEDPSTTGLPDGIPYGPCLGNHDHVGGTTGFNQFFGVSHFTGKPWYGGHLGEDNQNHFDLISASGLDFVVLYMDWNGGSLDYAPIDAWADSVLKSNAARRAIVVNHDILAVGGAWDPRGLDIYNNLKDNPNLFLMLSGHNHGEGYRQDTFEGRTVYSCLSDYQANTNGGNGFLRLYTFSPASNVIRVATYSPFLNQFMTNASSQFEMPYDMTSLATNRPPVAEPRAACVIHISVDGLRSDAVTSLGPTNLPNFYRLRTEGTFTDNARCDYDYSVTLPNHACQLTGRGVKGPEGHNWTVNSDPAPGATLESNKGAYIAGAFDVAHDNGLRTAEYASKSKFVLFATSWGATNGAPDVTGMDNGRNKVDVYLNQGNTAALVDALVAGMATQPCQYVFLHLADPDSVGHAKGWDPTPGSAYSESVKAMDSRLGQIFSLVDSNATLHGHTAILLTADHGGAGGGHGDPSVRESYTIPFYAWGAGVTSNADLYALNPGTRQEPGTERPPYEAPRQPIRNGDAANLALKLLGLGPVPGSTIGNAQDLALEPACN